MSKLRYRPAKTLHERRRRLLVGALVGGLTLVLYVPLLALLFYIDNDSPVVKPLLFAVLVGLPVGLGLFAEVRMGRRDQ